MELSKHVLQKYLVAIWALFFGKKLTQIWCYTYKYKENTNMVDICSCRLMPNEGSCTSNSKVWADRLCQILLETAQILTHFKIHKYYSKWKYKYKYIPTDFAN